MNKLITMRYAIMFAAAQNPFMQLQETIHSPLFWFMLFLLIMLSAYLYIYYVRSSNEWGIEERHLSSTLEQFGYELLSAEKKKPDAEIQKQIAQMVEQSGTNYSSIWCIKVLTQLEHHRREMEVWTVIYYHNHQIINVGFLPNIKDRNLEIV